ncbi:MAG: hypothetical protein Q7U04_14380 [Bacteriovorax sp.]|nr:hypothetical protein [Bacteriovorax sp.]
MLRILVMEILIVILMGGVPLVIGYKLGGIEQLGDVLKALMASDQFQLYAAILLLFNLLISGLEHWVFWSEKNRIVVKFIREVLSQLGNGLHGIVRVTSGMLLMFLIMWILIEPNSLQAEKVFVIVVFTAATFFASMTLAVLHLKLKQIER